MLFFVASKVSHKFPCHLDHFFCFFFFFIIPGTWIPVMTLHCTALQCTALPRHCRGNAVTRPLPFWWYHKPMTTALPWECCALPRHCIALHCIALHCFVLGSISRHFWSFFRPTNVLRYGKNEVLLFRGGRVDIPIPSHVTLHQENGDLDQALFFF